MEKSLDSGFENYRRERQRRRLESGETFRPLSQHDEAIKELEMAEAKEAQDRRLTREVHDFFEDATRTAASIVQKVSDANKAATTEKHSWEMEEFLVDAMRRVERFVALLKHVDDGPVEQILQTDMQRLVGDKLDGFRVEGTAALHDKHLGQDPFDIDIESVSAEIPDSHRKAREAESEEDDEDEGAGITTVEPPLPAMQVEDIEEHLVAEVAHEEPAPPEATPETAAPARRKPGGDPEVERFKAALKKLVRQGLMTKDEARAAYKAKIHGTP